MHVEARRPAVHRRELGDHVDLGGREPDLLLRLAQRRREQALVVRIGLPAGERELPSVQPAVGAHDQDDPQLAVRVAKDGHEHGRNGTRLLHVLIVAAGPSAGGDRAHASLSSAGAPERTFASRVSHVRLPYEVRCLSCVCLTPAMSARQRDHLWLAGAR